MTRPKRGKDSWWRMVKYPYNGAIYAVCKCGYERSAFRNYLHDKRGEFKRNESGELILLREPDNLKNYCPDCGARKKWWSNNIEEVEM